MESRETYFPYNIDKISKPIDLLFFKNVFKLNLIDCCVSIIYIIFIIVVRSKFITFNLIYILGKKV